MARTVLPIGYATHIWHYCLQDKYQNTSLALKKHRRTALNLTDLPTDLSVIQLKVQYLFLITTKYFVRSRYIYFLSLNILHALA